MATLMTDSNTSQSLLSDQLAQLTYQNQQLQLYRQLYLLQQKSLQTLLASDTPQLAHIFSGLFSDLHELLHFEQALLLTADGQQLLSAWPTATLNTPCPATAMTRLCKQMQHLYDLSQCQWWPANLSGQFPASRCALTLPIKLARSDVVLILLRNQLGDFSADHRELLQFFATFVSSTWSQLEERRLLREHEAWQRQRERIEQSMLRQEKMAAIGLLAAGVAHELNNPLGYIYSNLQTMQHYLAQLQQWLPPPLLAAQQHLCNDAADLLEESLEGARRARHIILQLRHFSHPDDSALSTLDFTEVLQNTLTMAASQLKHKTSVELALGADKAQVKGNANALSQLILNLLINASQAVPPGKGLIRVQLQLQQHWVRLAVSDNGHGIDPAQQAHIFNPFFTTKSVGEGSGLGLSIARAIAEAHGGMLTLLHSDSSGSCFLLMLPELLS